MALDVVKQLIDIEREGEDLVKKANALAIEVQKTAKEQAEQIIQEAKKKSEEYYASTLQRYEEEAKVESMPIVENNKKEIERLKNIPEDLLARSVNMVIERIVNSHGNC